MWIKYKKKEDCPVQAVQLTGKNIRDVAKYLATKRDGHRVQIIEDVPFRNRKIRVTDSDNDELISVEMTDWVVKDVEVGNDYFNWYIYSDTQFRLSYDTKKGK